MDSQTTTPDPGGDRASKKSVAGWDSDNRKYSTRPALHNTCIGCGRLCRYWRCPACAVREARR